MSLIPFHTVEPDVAERETRSITLVQALDDLPQDTYVLGESYCPDPACDCRRVMLNVVGEKNPTRFLAVISYGFDRDEEMAGPFLDLLNPQSRHAERLLDLVADSVLRDPAYVARLERHYALVKQAAADPGHPAYRRLRQGRRAGGGVEKVPRNAPCPCGSGKKYKFCCLRRDRQAARAAGRGDGG